MLATLGIAISVGLLSSLHCLGMCGGIAGLLAASLPGEVRHRQGVLLAYLAAYNAGRLTTYMAAGAAIGAFGTGLVQIAGQGYGFLLVKGLGAAVLAAIGLYIGGWLPALALVEGAGVPLWRRIEPWGRRLLPARSPAQAFLQGVVWGWLPCGLVYTSLLWAFSAGGAANGALVMLGFGLGTLPAMMGTGLVSRRLFDMLRQPYLRQAAGISIVLVAAAGLIYSGTIGDAICSALGPVP
ncbi:MAG: sulfite exporter TauE/SafE family protein [Magnetospirillum sp. WYHS-4]